MFAVIICTLKVKGEALKLLILFASVGNKSARIVKKCDYKWMAKMA